MHCAYLHMQLQLAAQHDAKMCTFPHFAALQQDKHQIELEAQSANVDDGDMRQLTLIMQQLETANSELKSQLAKEVSSSIRSCHCSRLAT